MLLLDAGNSRIKWALVQDGHWTHSGVFDSADLPSMKNEFECLPVPSRILVSNVAGEPVADQVRTLCAAWGRPLEFVIAQRQQCGVQNGYTHPQRLGSDRWAALIAAWSEVKGASLVVNCGTATTVDALSACGDFMGGLILPGLDLMQRSLASNTALLGQGGGMLCDFPLNTADAIHSGTLRATLGAIEVQYGLLKAKDPTLNCVLSGGAAELVKPLLSMPIQHMDNLVLRGLQIIGESKA